MVQPEIMRLCGRVWGWSQKLCGWETLGRCYFRKNNARIYVGARWDLLWIFKRITSRIAEYIKL